MNDKEEMQVYLGKMAKKYQRDAIESLMNNRARHGFQHFIADLKDSKFNKTGENWSLVNGLLKVKIPVDATTQAEVQGYINEQLSSAPWYKTTGDLIPGEFTYSVPIKTLGAFGPNRAVDPICIVPTDTGLKLLTIQRHDGKRALPGGMTEGGVLDTCVRELFEEVFSGDVFTAGSETSNIIDRINIVEFKDALRGILNDRRDAATFNETKESLLLMLDANESVTPSELLMAMLSTLNMEKFPLSTSTKLLQCLTHIKYRVYETLCATEFNEFKRIIASNARHGSEVQNISDPRNTDVAYMVTVPLTIVLTEDMVHAIGNCGLHVTATSAGDDATGAHFMSLVEFCDGEPYSDHASLVLNALNTAIAEDIIVLSSADNEQLLNLRLNKENDLGLFGKRKEAPIAASDAPRLKQSPSAIP